MSGAPVVFRIRSISLPAGSAGSRELGAAIEHELRHRLEASPLAQGTERRRTLSCPGGRVVVQPGASVSEIARGVAELVHGHVVKGAAG